MTVHTTDATATDLVNIALSSLGDAGTFFASARWVSRSAFGNNCGSYSGEIKFAIGTTNTGSYFMSCARVIRFFVIFLRGALLLANPLGAK
jgi:hypothetical protein